eukprot:TRINITY_DN7116_c0_g1_i1.p1 TRINITY_DN7116_c0_g1~~TRINITY_DN7116_c0_g1_i1.p1  ORF type:complete len:687 (+),score=94.28 TRINITY_DN7116_c0_g1_i1:611-2671(+)
MSRRWATPVRNDAGRTGVRNKVQDLKQKVSLLQEVMRKRKGMQPSHLFKELLESAPPGLASSVGDHSLVSDPMFTMMSNSDEELSPRMRRGRSPQRRSPVRSSPSIKELLEIDVSPSRARRSSDPSAVHARLFSRTISDTHSPSPVIRYTEQYDQHIITTPPRSPSSDYHHQDASTQVTATRSRNHKSSVHTQVNSSLTCNCGKVHSHGSPCRGMSESPIKVVSDYCVHATTGIRKDTPNYALPTWSSWPVGSRFAPVEIDRSARLPSPGRRRRQSVSPMLRNSPTPVSNSYMQPYGSITPMSRSSRRSSRGGSPRPKFRAASADGRSQWDRLYVRGMDSKQRKSNAAEIARQLREEEEIRTAAQYRYQPNYYKNTRGTFDYVEAHARHGPKLASRAVSTPPLRPRKERSPIDADNHLLTSTKAYRAGKVKKVSVPTRFGRKPSWSISAPREKLMSKPTKEIRSSSAKRETRFLEAEEEYLIEELFSYIDSDSDGYWCYSEALEWGKRAKGSTMSKDDWRTLCRTLGQHPDMGLTLEAIKRSYAATGTARAHYDLVFGSDYIKESSAAAATAEEEEEEEEDQIEGSLPSSRNASPVGSLPPSSGNASPVQPRSSRSATPQPTESNSIHDCVDESPLGTPREKGDGNVKGSVASSTDQSSHEYIEGTPLQSCTEHSRQTSIESRSQA